MIFRRCSMFRAFGIPSAARKPHLPMVFIMIATGDFCRRCFLLHQQQIWILIFSLAVTTTAPHIRNFLLRDRSHSSMWVINGDGNLDIVVASEDWTGGLSRQRRRTFKSGVPLGRFLRPRRRDFNGEANSTRTRGITAPQTVSICWAMATARSRPSGSLWVRPMLRRWWRFFQQRRQSRIPQPTQRTHHQRSLATLAL